MPTIQDAAHERRMLRRQIRSLGIECKYSPDQTADQLRDVVRGLGAEPFQACFYREWPNKVCLSRSGHEEDHYFGECEIEVATTIPTFKASLDMDDI